MDPTYDDYVYSKLNDFVEDDNGDEKAKEYIKSDIAYKDYLKSSPEGKKKMLAPIFRDLYKEDYLGSKGKYTEFRNSAFCVVWNTCSSHWSRK